MEEKINIISPEDVEKLLIKDEEKIKELQQEQYKQLLNSMARLSYEEHKYAYALQLEEHYRQTGNMEGLAESLAMQGRYHEAYELAEDETRKQEYLEKAKALEQSSRCDCPQTRREGKNDIPTRYVEYKHYDPERKVTINFMRCIICNNLYPDE